MPQFTAKRSMSPRSYEAAARRLERFARQLRERSNPQTPREQASLTSTIHGLAIFARDLSSRHRGVSMHKDIEDELRERGLISSDKPVVFLSPDEEK